MVHVLYTAKLLLQFDWKTLVLTNKKKERGILNFDAENIQSKFSRKRSFRIIQDFSVGRLYMWLTRDIRAF